MRDAQSLDPRDLFHHILGEMASPHPHRDHLVDLLEEFSFHVQKGGWIPHLQLHSMGNTMEVHVEMPG